MKIIIAPDKFKGSLSAREVCEAIQAGIRQVAVDAEIILHPLADGGEGSLDILAGHLAAEEIETIVQDPLFRPLRAAYLKNGETAYVEMARASGLPLLKPSERNARLTSTYGTGQLIRNAIQRGAKRLLLFVGGSATNDAGMGMAAALGYRFWDKDGQWVKPVGENLLQVARIDPESAVVDPLLLSSSVVSDVRNPLYGGQGAAYIFAPQKGANAEDVALLDDGLKHIANLIERDLGLQVAELPGAGAAGGLGAGGAAFLKADIRSGIDTMMQATGLPEQLDGADLIITGEGKFDGQSLQGKVVAGVAEMARERGIPCLVFAGSTSLSPVDYEPLGIRKVYTVMEAGMSLSEAIASAAERLKTLAAAALREIL